MSLVPASCKHGHCCGLSALAFHLMANLYQCITDGHARPCSCRTAHALHCLPPSLPLAVFGRKSSQHTGSVRARIHHLRTWTATVVRQRCLSTQSIHSWRLDAIRYSWMIRPRLHHRRPTEDRSGLCLGRGPKTAHCAVWATPPSPST